MGRGDEAVTLDLGVDEVAPLGVGELVGVPPAPLGALEFDGVSAGDTAGYPITISSDIYGLLSVV